MKRFVRVLCGLGLTMCALSAPQASAADPKVELCNAANAPDAEAAVAACTALLPLQLSVDERVAVLATRARHYSSVSKYERALADLDQAIKLNPSPTLAAAAYYFRSMVALILKKEDLALTDAIDAAKLDPTVAYYWKRRGILFAARNQAEMAFHDFDQAIKLDANDPETYFQRGEFRLSLAILNNDLDAYNAAMADYTDAIRLKPNYGEAFASRCWLRNNRPLNLHGATDPQALPDCNEGVRLAGSATAYNSRAVLYVSLDRNKDALTDANVAVKKAPAWAAPLFVRGIAKQRTGDDAGGNADIAAAEKLDPNIAKTYTKYFPWFRDFNAKPAMTERRKQMLKDLCPKGWVSEDECKEAGITP